MNNIWAHILLWYNSISIRERRREANGIWVRVEGSRVLRTYPTFPHHANFPNGGSFQLTAIHFMITLYKLMKKTVRVASNVKYGRFYGTRMKNHFHTQTKEPWRSANHAKNYVSITEILLNPCYKLVQTRDLHQRFSQNKTIYSMYFTDSYIRKYLCSYATHKHEISFIFRTCHEINSSSFKFNNGCV